MEERVDAARERVDVADARVAALSSDRIRCDFVWIFNIKLMFQKYSMYRNEFNILISKVTDERA